MEHSFSFKAKELNTKQLLVHQFNQPLKVNEWKGLKQNRKPWNKIKFSSLKFGLLSKEAENLMRERQDNWNFVIS